MVRLPGAGVPILQQETIAMLREFFVQSGAWLVEAAPVSIKALQDTYYLDPQPDGDVLYIHRIAFPTGDRFKFLTVSQQQSFRGKVNAPSAIPISYHGYINAPGKFTLTPPVTTDMPKALIPYVVMTIKERCGEGQTTSVPSWMLRYWKDHWIDGLLGRLMSIPDKPYSNLMQAQYHMRRYRNGISQARDMGRRQFNNSETDFKFPGWA
tara:strand:- start:3949 stop:4575 length:627 start_codon:yes stop_codon:yes gene_type:complete